jgi:predicted metal-dependent HD superfamily phosphohydrolase
VTSEESRLLSQWVRLVPGRPDVGTEILGRYRGPGRWYHDVAHLGAVLDAVEILSSEAADVRPVALAAWFHDAVYDPRRDDNEEQSAVLAEEMLPAVGVSPGEVREVARLVRLTATHDPAAQDANGAVLCDADLRVLAADEEAYQAYTAAVRAEYAQVPDDDFRAGRMAVLEQLLALPALFRTSRAHEQWEPVARRNVQDELTRLRAASRQA